MRHCHWASHGSQGPLQGSITPSSAPSSAPGLTTDVPSAIRQVGGCRRACAKVGRGLGEGCACHPLTARILCNRKLDLYTGCWALAFLELCYGSSAGSGSRDQPPSFALAAVGDGKGLGSLSSVSPWMRRCGISAQDLSPRPGDAGHNNGERTGSADSGHTAADAAAAAAEQQGQLIRAIVKEVAKEKTPTEVRSAHEPFPILLALGSCGTAMSAMVQGLHRSATAAPVAALSCRLVWGWL